MTAFVVPVRISRDGTWQTVDFHTLTDDELAAFAAGKDALEGWRWALRLARVAAGAIITTGGNP